MNKSLLIYTFICLSILSTLAVANEDIQIKKNGKQPVLVLSERVKLAIEKVVPNFTAWKLSDYLPSISEDSSMVNVFMTPFAVITDINRDGKQDLVVDGANDKEYYTIVVLSTKLGFDASIIEHYERDDIDTVKSIENGKLVTGLNRFLWFNEYVKKRDRTYAFDIMYKQIETENGGLSDPGSTKYYFRKGKLISETVEG